MARRDPRGDLLLGLGVAMLTINFHSLFEYVILAKEPQYVWAIIVGMTLGLAHQIRTTRFDDRLETTRILLKRSAGRLLH
jgi:hypothetical protein